VESVELKTYLVERTVPLTHLVPSPYKGELEGRCAFCFCETSKGFPLKKSVSEAFTDYSELHGSQVVCPHCYYFLKEPKFRKSCWAISQNTAVFLKKSEVVKYIEGPPQPPYAVYVTKTFKKHGWIRMMFRGVNYSRERIVVGYDTELVWFPRTWFLEVLELVRTAVAKGVSKKRLYSRTLTPRDLEKIGLDLYESLKSIWGGLDYELAVYLA